jgi:pyridoxine/pyridoxamine 5'-phosphate oxidase
MKRAELLAFMRRYRVAVATTVSTDRAPQAAVVGIAVSDQFEVVFDTLQTSRKARNLRQNPGVALVFGGWGLGEEQTLQYEGVADEPTGAELKRMRELYFSVYPEGRARLASWGGLIHVRVRPIWTRYSDFGQSPERVLEYTAGELETLE